MRYQGITSILATINIGCTQQAFEKAKEDENISKVINILNVNGSEYKVLIPNAVRSIDDMKAIAFECVTGLRFKNHIQEFIVEIQNLKFLNDKEFIMCMPVSEKEDFEEQPQPRADEQEKKK